MVRYNFNFVVFMVLMVASMQFCGTMAQTRHVVGDVLGWTIPPGGAAAYTTWASLQTFTVGDTLFFNFTNGQHDVAEVSASAYDPCTATSPISLATTGPATLSLTTPGSHYYICTFTSHCQIGQKLTINVSATGAATPPSATPTSPPPSATTPPMAMPPTTMPSAPCPPTSSPNSSPSPPQANTTPPRPTSGVSSFDAMTPITFLAIAIVFLNY